MNLKKADLIAVDWVKDYIDKHYNEEITIHKLSIISNLNPNKLQFGFKKIFQITIYSYITDLRMKNAAKLLLSTDMSIKEIASEVGYRKTKVFCPRFKNFHNQTATGYRRTHSIQY